MLPEIVKNKNYKILTPHGWCDFDGIFVSKSKILELTLDTNKKIKVSEMHEFLCMDDKWRDSGKIFHLDLQLKTGEYINSITIKSEDCVYDPINVDNSDHAYYSNGVISHNCLLDEYSFVSPNIAKDFFTSIYPTIKGLSNGRMAIISTPSGYNFFYEMCEKAKAGLSNFKYSEIKWTDVPGRDDKFKRETIADIGEARFEQEFECVRDSTLINIRDKETGVISNVTIREFIEMCKS